MSNRSGVYAVCFIGLIVSIPLYHIRSKSLESKLFNPLKGINFTSQAPAGDAEPALPTIGSVLTVAKPALKAAYGNDAIDNESPLLINLENNIWTVVSSPKEGRKGGVLQIRIDKITGKILNISHG
ncbi:hypothetical protein D0T84_03995 [Dysgonomonas sp. 521]|uniref:NTF2 fold immunity protein n=1 Tax=Dysgonomonas sp. 521 TaxID=2302932 RepID=UPI0013D37863|nr:NTF2 fold immunity protein [Dysgonomonas sp. 521]NDV94080.1 hypothetical protein [Dysgonomonas sp. 521]